MDLCAAPSSTRHELERLASRYMKQDGDFGGNLGDSWTPEDFKSRIVTKEGNKRLLTGDVVLDLKEGIGYVGIVRFPRTQTWTKKLTYRLGAIAMDDYIGTKIREGFTDSFFVQDRGLTLRESTFKHVRRHYKIPRWPPRKKNLDQSRSEILEIGKLDSVENNTFEMDLIHNDVKVVNTIEEGVAIASLDKQHNSFEISAGNQGGELAVDGLAINNGENMGNNIGEQLVAIASRENRHNNATIFSIGVINSNISLQPLVESNVVHNEENVGGAAKMLNGELPPRNGIDISLEELMEVSGMKRKDAAKRLNVSESTFKRVRRHYKIPRWPPRKKNLDQSCSEILEIGKLDSVENNTLEMDLIHNDVNVVNTIEEGVAIASLDKQHNSFEISTGNRGGELAVDGLAINNGENMGNNIGEQPVAIASRENQHNNATISCDERGGELAIGVINSDISQQPLVEANVVHTEETVSGVSEECIINSSKLPPRTGIDISLEDLEKVYGMKREGAAERLNVSISTFKRVCRHYGITRWPPRKKNLDHSRSGNSTQSGSTKELGGSASTVQNESLVTIKAKYGDNFIKFKLSTSSGIHAFNQQVSKRLKLEAGSYVVKYQDEDNDWILVACDDDLRDYISSSVSLGKTTLIMLLEHI